MGAEFRARLGYPISPDLFWLFMLNKGVIKFRRRALNLNSCLYLQSSYKDDSLYPRSPAGSDI